MPARPPRPAVRAAPPVGPPLVRQELVDPRCRVRLQTDEHVGQVVERVDAVGLAGGDVGEEPGHLHSRSVVPNEEPVLSFMRSLSILNRLRTQRVCDPGIE